MQWPPLTAAGSGDGKLVPVTQSTATPLMVMVLGATKLPQLPREIRLPRNTSPPYRGFARGSSGR